MSWQPIETAPKAATILICVQGHPKSVWIARDKGITKRVWHEGNYGPRLRIEATHWQPLPSPPA